MYNIKVKCRYCGKILKVKYFYILKTKKFCSHKCCGMYKKSKRIKKICMQCKKKYYVIQNRFKSKFCSKKCHYNYIKSKKIKKICKWCKKVYYVTRLKRKFCSHKCYGKWRTKKKEKKCLYCNKEFKIFKYQRKKFCSLNCYWKWVSINLIGKERYNWRNGISKEPYDWNFDKTLKKRVKKRDGYICQICRKKTYNGHCHHIHYIKKDSRPKTLIYLDIGCHHRTYHNKDYWFAYFCNILNQKPEEVFS